MDANDERQPLRGALILLAIVAALAVLVALRVLTPWGGHETASAPAGEAGRPAGAVQPAQAPAPQIAASSQGPAPAAGVASPGGPVCHAIIAEALPDAPRARQVSLAPGARLVVEVRCTGDPAVVHLVVSLPPPMGVLQVLPTDRLEDAGWQRLWGWAGEIPAGMPPGEQWFWPWADGQPAGEPVVLVVTRPQTG